MEDDNPYERLAQRFNALPEQIQQAYEEATIEEIDKAADKLKTFLLQNSGSETLNAKIDDKTRKIDHQYYEREITWNDKRIVNLDQKKAIGRDINKKRAKGKRNFSLHPATYKDLAYIINYGHGGVVGNQFIKRGLRRIKNWRKDRDITLERKLDKTGKEFTE